MPNAKKEDNQETYDEVLRPMLDRVSRVCRAFEIPFTLIVQPHTSEEHDIIRGEIYTPQHTAFNIMAASYLLSAKDIDDLEQRIMSLAEYTVKKHLSGMAKSNLRELFSEMLEEKETAGKKDGEEKLMN